jgi:glycosyltransferase involved in cell wall biosynthesis
VDHRQADVAIDARAAVRGQIGGVERLAREMVVRLPRLNPARYRVIRPAPMLAHRAGHLWEQLVLPLRVAGASLIYCPANLAPVLSARTVVVVHDAGVVRHPEAYSRQYVAYHRLMLAAIVRRARRLITVSEFSRGELVELLGAPAEHITVIPEGVDERFSPRTRGAPPSALGLSGPYVLIVGTASERKNIGVLAQASRALGERRVELVMAGSDRPYLRAGELPVRRLGYVPDEHLPSLYAGALALVQPSRYEGFGLPCLEAMACGTPVVAANCAALPEIIGDAGLLVDPDDSDGFAQALTAVAFEDPLRDRLIAAGLRRAAGFSWDRAVQLTDALISTLLRPDPLLDSG